MTGGKNPPADGAPSAESTGSPQASPGSVLRRRAETMAREKAVRSPDHLEAMLPEEVPRILHERRVHPIELEMRNDELRRAREELEASRGKAGGNDPYRRPVRKFGEGAGSGCFG